MQALIQRLESQSLAISRRVLDAMYQDPFWQERFGDRGSRHAEQDGQYHVSYLVQALSASDAGVLTGYARWLQSLLVSRGMCSRHLAENFERLEQTIAVEIPESEPAVKLLRAARAALLHDHAGARQLQGMAEEIADAAVVVLPQGREDMLYLAAYLADAIAVGRADLFSAHVVWTRAFLERRQVPADHLQQALQWLDEYLAQHAESSPALHVVSHEFIMQALQRLRKHRA